MRKAAILCPVLIIIICLSIIWQQNSAGDVPEYGGIAEMHEPVPIPSSSAKSPADEPEAPETNQLFFEKLREHYQNEDIVGYLKIEGTTIDYPVVQSRDNDFYLEHDINKDKSAYGWIFLDYENDIVRNDKNTVIYGHNMKKDIMFHSLRYYTSEDYYKDHRYIIWSTVYEDCIWEIFSFYKTDISFGYIQVIFPSEEDFYKLVCEMKGKSLYDTGVTVMPEDSILTLSTCVSGTINERYVANAKKLTPDTKSVQDY